MGNYGSKLPDAGTGQEDDGQCLKKGRKATKRISKITLFVIVGSSALFEVKRTQHLPACDASTAADANGELPKKSDIQISIRQLPVDGNPIAEGAMTTDDLASIKLQKARRNSIHSFSLNFDRERLSSKPLEFEVGQHGDDDDAVSKEGQKSASRVAVGLECAEDDGEAPVRVRFEFKEERELPLASHQDPYEDDAESDCSDSSSFALQISQLAASAIESENETVEKWGEKLAKAIESKIGQPTSVVIKKSSRGREKKKAGKKTKSASKQETPAPQTDDTPPDAAVETDE